MPRRGPAPAGGGATLLNASVEGSLGGPSVASISMRRNVWKDKATKGKQSYPVLLR